MKIKHLFLAQAFFALFSLPTVHALAAQEGEVAKKGLNFGPLPVVGYSSDYGWHYGALVDIYHYGDGSQYPEYLWKLNVEASWYSKGNSIYHAFFDAKSLIPGIRLSAAVSYFGNKTSSFYGFNGGNSLYVRELDKITPQSDKKNAYGLTGQGFYLMKRSFFRVVTCVQGKFGDGKWGWAGGLTYWNITTGHAVNKGLHRNEEGVIDDFSLYDAYVRYGLIPAAQQFGGRHLEGKAGVVFDTRDHENNPSRGTNVEAYLFGSPDWLNARGAADKTGYLKLAVHAKQFFTLVPERLVFGAHLAYQGLIAGKEPFYMLQGIQSINMKQNNTEGLGSASTLRGTVAPRLLGDGYAWSNWELRWRFAKFRLFNQNFSLVANPFFDAGMVVQPYHAEGADIEGFTGDATVVNTLTSQADGETKVYKLSDFYSEGRQKIHMGAGMGLHVLMNQNFNVRIEVGKCLDPNDGNLGIEVGLNYIF